MRLAIVVALVIGFVLARRVYLQWRARLHTETRHVPRLPAELLDGADRTWVVFTTPYCATCEPVKQRLAEHDPGARLVTIDATREPQLASAFHVRSAPTVLLADSLGDVQARLVGAGAVDDYVRSPA
jgi:thiol-disulfide isomerase/thioredoxin